MISEQNPQATGPEPDSDPPMQWPIPPNNKDELSHAKAQAPGQSTSPASGLPPNRVTGHVEWLSLGINGVLAVVGIAAICIYGCQLKVMHGQLTEMQKQNTLTRQQLVGSLAAVMQLVYDVTENGLDVFVDNRGHVTTKATVHLVITRLSLPSKQPIGQPSNCAAVDSQPIAPPFNVTDHSLQTLCPIPGLGRPEYEGSFRHLEEAVKVEVSNSHYEDGFGDTNLFPSECWIFLAKGWGISGDGPIGNATRIPCSQFDIGLRDAMQEKTRYENQWRQQQTQKPN